MRPAVFAQMIWLSKTIDGRISSLVRKSIEVGVVVPSVIARRLSEAGYSVAASKSSGRQKIFESTISLRGVLVSRASAVNEEDALLLAVYAAMKDEQAKR